MKELQLFNFKGTSFTVITIESKDYWVAKEICEELDIKNHSDAVGKLKDNSQKRKLTYEECKKIGLTDLQELKIGVKGLMLLTESGVYKLAFKSDKPNAEDFTDWISEEVIPNIRNTGKYDLIEQQLKLIEDEKERNLKLTIYQLDGILKVNPSDMLTGIMRNQKQTELDTYLQSKELKSIKDSVEEMNKKVSNMVVIGDRKQFSNEVNSIARATGKEQSEIYTLTYKQLENEYGIDLKSRCENKKKKIQNDRLEQGKKPLSPSTLKQKVNNLTIADEEELWSELGKCLYAVKNELLK